MDLLVTCDNCKGTCVKDKTHYDIENKIRTIETTKCERCNGKGILVKKKHYLTYELILARRKVDYYWKLLKHEYDLPSYYFYDMSEECPKCNGKGYIEEISHVENKTIIKENTCKNCNGTGIIDTKTTKEIYEEIFAEYLKNKKLRDEIVQILHKEEWKDEKYSQYEEIHPSGYNEVCVRCKTYFEAGDNLNACCGCTNESMCPENGCYFEPFNEKYREWFIENGYKKCIGYTNKYKHWKDI